MSSDWNLLNAARDGDHTSCSILFKKYNKSIISLSSLITGSLDSAKDIAQETFIRLLNSSIKNQEGNFKTYITTIAYRLALKEKSRIGRNQSLHDLDFPDSSVSLIENQVYEENQKRIFNTIHSLPEKHRDILVLRFYSKLNYEDIADITDVPVGTVKSRIFYAVKACKEKLKLLGVLE